MDMTIEPRECNGKLHDPVAHAVNTWGDYKLPQKICKICSGTGFREVVTVDLGPHMRAVVPLPDAFLTWHNWMTCGVVSAANWE